MKAFTIIELIIAYFIMSLIAGGIFAVTNIAILSWNLNNGMLGTVQEVRQAMEGMTKESRQGLAVAVNNGGSRLDFHIPDVSDTISYYVQNQQLIREYPPTKTLVLANNINNLNFNLNAAVLQIQIQATKIVRNAPLSFALTEEVRLRNE